MKYLWNLLAKEFNESEEEEETFKWNFVIIIGLQNISEIL